MCVVETAVVINRLFDAPALKPLYGIELIPNWKCAYNNVQLLSMSVVELFASTQLTEENLI